MILRVLKTLFMITLAFICKFIDNSNNRGGGGRDDDPDDDMSYKEAVVRASCVVCYVVCLLFFQILTLSVAGNGNGNACSSDIGTYLEAAYNCQPGTLADTKGVTSLLHVIHRSIFNPLHVYLTEGNRIYHHQHHLHHHHYHHHHHHH